MSEMMERVAFVIEHSRKAGGTAHDMAWAAIRAMRNPTDAMIVAGEEALVPDADCVDLVWNAMIVAAEEED